MTGSTTPIMPLPDKLSLVTHHHLITRVPVKLDLENWNYASWVYFFEQLCHGYEVTKYIHGDTSTDTSSSDTSFSPEEKKVDTIVLSWIFTTLSDDPQARLVVERPRSAKEAWTLLTNIVHDNKRSRTIALKAELRSLKLGELSIDAYFRKIESIATVLTSLGSPISSEDIVTFAPEGLPEKYDNVCGIMHHRETFPDLKTARSMLTTEEMRLKSKSHSLPMDSSSSSPLILMAEKGTSRNPSNPQIKSRNPCINFARGACRYGVGCKFVHDPNHKPTYRPTQINDQNSTEQIVLNLLGKLGLTGVNKSNTGHPSITNPSPTGPSAYLTTNNTSSQPYTAHYMSPVHTLHPPPGFGYPPTHSVQYTNPTSFTNPPGINLTQPINLSPFTPAQHPHQAQLTQTGPPNHQPTPSAASTVWVIAEFEPSPCLSGFGVPFGWGLFRPNKWYCHFYVMELLFRASSEHKSNKNDNLNVFKEQLPPKNLDAAPKL
ncbi:hypothetical protein CTI12_AA060850 [Artemisia annua]|uniref:C3H1-type domain-containing protein n=1 Tax=Artemisia annua TaxID=35608 RepID=A0A2U1PI96_ARTAN|nr:hypothetical protein CTI12_AA060850 [Artemisia annua]